MTKTPIFPLPTNRVKNAKRGYTLAELLVVLVILGLITAIAAPRLLSRSDVTLLRRDTALLTNVLRSAKVAARRTGVSTRVFIEPSAKRVWVEGQEKILFLDQELSVSATGAEVESVDDIIGIRFFADGMSTGGEIKLGTQNTMNTIEVIWANGEVRFAQD